MLIIPELLLNKFCDTHLYIEYQLYLKDPTSIISYSMELLLNYKTHSIYFDLFMKNFRHIINFQFE